MGHSHAHHQHGDTNPERYKATRKVTLVGAAVNVFLCVVQLVGGFFSHSAALVADGFHTLSDLLSDFVVLFAAKKANEEADEEHPYGHGRIETLATIILGALLIAVAVGMLFNLAERLITGQRLPQPTVLALFLAALGILCKETLYRFTKSTAEKINSDMLRANAWHHRSDALSSILVLIGVSVNLAGIKFADTVAAILVAALIARIGFGLVYQSAQQLIDSALDEETIKTIKSAIDKVDGVEEVHELRTRKSGDRALADVRIQVSPRVSVSEGHQISETVRRKIMQDVPDMQDVVVHTEAEYHHHDVSDLPLRKELVTKIATAAAQAGLAEFDDDLTLHYLNDGVEVELRIPTAAFTVNREQFLALRQNIEKLEGVLECSYILRPDKNEI